MDGRRGTPKDPERAQRLILEAALRCFAADGYRSVRVSDIAKLAGYSEATVFHHFGTKADLFRAVVSTIDGKSSWFRPGASGEEFVQQMYEGELAYQRDGRLRGLDRVWSEALAGEPDLVAMVRPQVSAAIDGVEALLATFATGSADQSRPLANFLMAVSYGARVMRRYDPDALSHEACADLMRFAAKTAVGVLRDGLPGIEPTPVGAAGTDPDAAGEAGVSVQVELVDAAVERLESNP